jgi:hypothetical protein
MSFLLLILFYSLYMALILFISSVLALECNKPCIDSCVLNPITECLTPCCSNLSLSLSSSCSLTCEESSQTYICEQKCVPHSASCESNCQDFCTSRADDCNQACIYEFCGEKSHSINWVFVIGLIFLFTGFLITLYLQLENIQIKPLEA